MVTENRPLLPNGIISLSRQWAKIGNIKEYIPIGWLEYSGCLVLYDVRSSRIYLEDFDNEGQVNNEPIANSFKELILNLEPCMVLSKKEK